MLHPAHCVPAVVLLLSGLASCARAQATTRPTTNPAPAPAGSPAAVLLEAAAMIPTTISMFPIAGDPVLDALVAADHPVYALLVRGTEQACAARSFGDGFVPSPGQVDAVQRLANVGMLRATTLYDQSDAGAAADLSLAGVVCGRFLGLSGSYEDKRREVDVVQSGVGQLTRRLRALPPDALARAADRMNTLPPMIAPADVLRGEAKRLLATPPDALADELELAGDQPLTPAQVKAVSDLFDAVAQVISTHPAEMEAHVDALIAPIATADPKLAESLGQLRNFVVDFGRSHTVYEVRLDLTRAAIAVAREGPHRVADFRDYFGDGPFAHQPLGTDGAYEIASDLDFQGRPLAVRVN